MPFLFKNVKNLPRKCQESLRQMEGHHQQGLQQQQRLKNQQGDEQQPTTAGTTATTDTQTTERSHKHHGVCNVSSSKKRFAVYQFD
jgi:hypothetical protein